MKTTSAMLAFVLAATTSSLWAQQPIPPATPIPPQTSQSVGDSLVKQVSFVNGLPLREAIRMLQAECPGFQAVIVPDPGCAEVNPGLPEMSLKNLPLSQILDVISKSLPEVGVQRVSSSKGDVSGIFWGLLIGLVS